MLRNIVRTNVGLVAEGSKKAYEELIAWINRHQNKGANSVVYNEAKGEILIDDNQVYYTTDRDLLWRHIGY